MPTYLQNYPTSYLKANKINHIPATPDPVCIVMMTQCYHLMIRGTCLMQQTTLTSPPTHTIPTAKPRPVQFPGFYIVQQMDCVGFYYDAQ